MKRNHLITAGIVIVVGLLAVWMFYYSQKTAQESQNKCQAKGLEIFTIESTQICRDHDTGLLYAP